MGCEGNKQDGVLEKNKQNFPSERWSVPSEEVKVNLVLNDKESRGGRARSRHPHMKRRSEQGPLEDHLPSFQGCPSPFQKDRDHLTQWMET